MVLSVCMSVIFMSICHTFVFLLERGFKIANFKAQIEFRPFFTRISPQKSHLFSWVEFHPLFELNFASFFEFNFTLFLLNLSESSNITSSSEENLRLVNLPLKKGQIEYSICLIKIVILTDP